MNVTIGIPFYNVGHFLEESIKSVFSQSFTNWELILIDDGSTDNSLDIAKSIADPRIRVISDGKNKKLPARLNQIVQEAKYDYIARMDADDLMSPDRILKQLDFLVKHPEYDLVSTGVCSLSLTNEPVGYRCDVTGHKFTGKTLIQGCHGIVHASILGRKEWFIRNPYNPLDFTAEDYNLWIKSFVKEDLNLYIMAEPLYYYREDLNITKKKLLAAYKNKRQIIKEYGPLFYSYFDIVKLYSISLLKSVSVILLAKLGQISYLKAKRNRQIQDNRMKLKFETEIQEILNINLP